MKTPTKPKGYALTPMQDPPAGAISTACVIQCIVTGEYLAGSGGGSLTDHVSLQVAAWLRTPEAKAAYADYNARVQAARGAGSAPE